jgi:TPR repeat protein
MGRGAPVNFTEAAEQIQRATNSDDTNDTNTFGTCLEESQRVEEDMKCTIPYYRKAAVHGYIDGMKNFGRCLEYGKGIDEDFLYVAKYDRLAA